MSPALSWVDGLFSFETAGPGARCAGRVVLLPVVDDEADEEGAVVWRIWSLSTWVEELEGHGEDEGLLRMPGRELDDEEVIETDVFVVGGGNA